MRLTNILAFLSFATTLAYANVISNGNFVQHFDGHQVIRAIVSNSEQYQALVDLYNSEHNFDFWNGPTKTGATDILVEPSKLEFLEGYLQQNKIPFSIMINDVEKLVREERSHRLSSGLLNARVDMSWTEYHSSETIINWIYSLAETHSDIASTQVIGKSTEGRDLVLLKITTGGSGKPAILIDGTFHAREWISPAVTTYIVNELLNNRAQYQDILNAVDFYIIPIVNIDGYEFTQLSNRMWRKTRSDNDGACLGVDPNRNFDFHFGESGASNNKCSETYHGPYAFSEPETAALADFITSNAGSIKWTVYISMHSYSQLFLSPWNWTTDLPADDDDIMAMSGAAVDAIRAVHGKSYTAGSGANVLYYSSGCSVDWAKAEGGFKYGYTIELRDTGTYGFILPPAQIIPNSEEIWAAVQVMARMLF